MTKPRPPAEMSMEFGDDELLTEEGTELEVKLEDGTGTRTETVVIPWSDQGPPKGPEPS